MRNYLQKQFLSPLEAASFLGISINYLYQLNSKGIIPYYRPNNGKVYYKKQDLEDWINGKK